MTQRLIAAGAFLAVVVGANVLTVKYGLVDWLGITATAGTWLAGFAFVARDRVQETAGARWVIGCILAGAVISALFSPRIALASCVAFLASELADYAVYTPLRRRNRHGAAIASNIVGAIVDTILFLTIAGFPLSAIWGQLAIKIGLTTLFVGITYVVFRQPVNANNS